MALDSANYNPGELQRPERRRRSSSSESSFISPDVMAMIDQIIQSNDSVAADQLKEQLFQSTESALLISGLLKSFDVGSKQGKIDVFKSNSSYLAGIVSSMDLCKSDGGDAQSNSAPPQQNSLSKYLESTEPLKIGTGSGLCSSVDWVPKDVTKSNIDVDVNRVFRTMEQSESTTQPQEKSLYSSMDWLPKDVTKSDVEVDLSKVFRTMDKFDESSVMSPAVNGTHAKTDWDALYRDQLPPTVAVASSPQPIQKEKESFTATCVAKPKKDKSKRKCPRRSKEPDEVKIYVKFTELDVLMGRGGRTNHHPGNIRYLEEKERIQARYRAATKNDKTYISQELVDIVHEWGGRFLKLDEDNVEANCWYEVPNIVARKKASQTLREVNTAEVRAAKRAIYKK